MGVYVGGYALYHWKTVQLLLDRLGAVAALTSPGCGASADDTGKAEYKEYATINWWSAMRANAFIMT